MTITLNFGYSPNKFGYCQHPPRFDHVEISYHDGHQEYAAEVADVCIEAAKKAVANVAKRKECK